MTTLDVAAIFSAALVLLAIGGVIADMAYAQRPSDRRHQAHRR